MEVNLNNSGLVSDLPTVTVVIINWNSAGLLRHCLENLLLQTFTPQRILIMDNASSDDSALGIESLPNVSLHRLDINLGFAKGNNQALRVCDTDFVALLNPDAFPDATWLENLVTAAQTYPNVTAFGSRQMLAGSCDILDGAGDVYHISGKVWRNGKDKPYLNKKDKPSEIFSPCACAALYRREALLSVGGFDEDYFCYVEDVDLGFRLRLAGHKALYVPDAVVHHVGSGTTGGQHSDFSVYHGHRNLVWTFIKNMPGLLFWLLLPLHVMLNLVTVVYFVLRGQGRVIIQAKFDAIKGIPKMLKKRKVIQQNRKASIKEIWRVLDKRWLPFRRV